MNNFTIIPSGLRYQGAPSVDEKVSITLNQNSQQITELFGFDYCNVPRQYLHQGVKDWADLARDFGMNTVETILKKKNIL